MTTTTDIENFPGYPEGISGTQMMDDLRRQAERFGTDLRYGVATAADLSRSPYKITIDEERLLRRKPLLLQPELLPNTWDWKMRRSMPVWVSALVPPATVSFIVRRS